ncbi:hypothetical protein [Sphingobium sp. DC-2]|uniref:hypothetical protein n=1 Tax=Sphingobium sp. DC-2 TaxID=1303256 RepID=UPI0004C2CEBD|nr:hypothetical protein [Sphingobium sp. DC-2]
MTRSLRQARHTNEAPQAWINAYSWADECDRREAERDKPHPVITPCLLAVFALSVFAVNLAVFGKGAW